METRDLDEFLTVLTLFYIMSLLMIPHFCRVLVCEAAGFALGRFLLNRRHCGTFRGRNRMLALNFGLDQFLENNGSLIVSLFEKLSIVVGHHLVNDLSFCQAQGQGQSQSQSQSQKSKVKTRP